MDLRTALHDTIATLDQLIVTVEDSARRQDLEPTEAMTPDGHLVLAPLLTAKAHALAALVALGEDRDHSSTTTGGADT
jgi:hypothetical protein